MDPSQSNSSSSLPASPAPGTYITPVGNNAPTPVHQPYPPSFYGSSQVHHVYNGGVPNAPMGPPQQPQQMSPFNAGCYPPAPFNPYSAPAYMSYGFTPVLQSLHQMGLNPNYITPSGMMPAPAPQPLFATSPQFYFQPHYPAPIMPFANPYAQPHFFNPSASIGLPPSLFLASPVGASSTFQTPQMVTTPSSPEVINPKPANTDARLFNRSLQSEPGPDSLFDSHQPLSQQGDPTKSEMFTFVNSISEDLQYTAAVLEDAGYTSVHSLLDLMTSKSDLEEITAIKPQHRKLLWDRICALRNPKLNPPTVAPANPVPPELPETRSVSIPFSRKVCQVCGAIDACIGATVSPNEPSASLETCVCVPCFLADAIMNPASSVIFDHHAFASQLRAIDAERNTAVVRSLKEAEITLKKFSSLLKWPLFDGSSLSTLTSAHRRLLEEQKSPSVLTIESMIKYWERIIDHLASIKSHIGSGHTWMEFQFTEMSDYFDAKSIVFMSSMEELIKAEFAGPLERSVVEAVEKAPSVITDIFDGPARSFSYLKPLLAHSGSYGEDLNKMLAGPIIADVNPRWRRLLSSSMKESLAELMQGRESFWQRLSEWRTRAESGNANMPAVENFLRKAEVIISEDFLMESVHDTLPGKTGLAVDSLSLSVKNSMLDVYKTASLRSGHGVVQACKADLSSFIRADGGAIFQSASSKLMRDMIEFVKELADKVQEIYMNIVSRLKQAFLDEFPPSVCTDAGKMVSDTISTAVAYTLKLQQIAKTCATAKIYSLKKQM
eukprot:TRINITY_DN104_c0_g3_i2.p1 TRINITY_DN104_c0_g3~~TRINITY_DN104_c0_g3_i2.p1  ORF type:complete len:778 (-),score=122.67 TRINITY_DN104_c0_g3_i2:1684-4017(-)